MDFSSAKSDTEAILFEVQKDPTKMRMLDGNEFLVLEALRRNNDNAKFITKWTPNIFNLVVDNGMLPLKWVVTSVFKGQCEQTIKLALDVCCYERQLKRIAIKYIRGLTNFPEIFLTSLLIGGQHVDVIDPYFNYFYKFYDKIYSVRGVYRLPRRLIKSRPEVFVDNYIEYCRNPNEVALLLNKFKVCNLTDKLIKAVFHWFGKFEPEELITLLWSRRISFETMTKSEFSFNFCLTYMENVYLNLIKPLPMSWAFYYVNNIHGYDRNAISKEVRDDPEFKNYVSLLEDRRLPEAFV